MNNPEQKTDVDNMNYNDRLDGYGFGESESLDTDKEYQSDPHFTKHCIDLGEGYRRHLNEPFTFDEYGLRNQYGPVDQYVFRSYHLVTREDRIQQKLKEELEELEDESEEDEPV